MTGGGRLRLREGYAAGGAGGLPSVGDSCGVPTGGVWRLSAGRGEKWGAGALRGRASVEHAVEVSLGENVKERDCAMRVRTAVSKVHRCRCARPRQSRVASATRTAAIGGGGDLWC
jgi:hypothetical protein